MLVMCARVHVRARVCVCLCARACVRVFVAQLAFLCEKKNCRRARFTHGITKHAKHILTRTRARSKGVDARIPNRDGKTAADVCTLVPLKEYLEKQVVEQSKHKGAVRRHNSDIQGNGDDYDHEIDEV